MAIRLMSWLATSPSSDKQKAIESFEQIANDYARDGGFVDWARQTLFFGDPLQTLSAAYGRLCDVVTQRRELQSKMFAQRMADWIAAGADARAILLAPTAGGKTEAALFPVLSRMLAENWSGLIVPPNRSLSTVGRDLIL